MGSSKIAALAALEHGCGTDKPHPIGLRVRRSEEQEHKPQERHAHGIGEQPRGTVCGALACMLLTEFWRLLWNRVWPLKSKAALTCWDRHFVSDAMFWKL